MRIATWNVNSIRARVDRVTDWLGRADIDVLAMQEIKCREHQFPFAAFEAAGYEVAMHGLNQWNGVAFASRIGIDDIEQGFPGMPGFGPDEALEARALGATFEGTRLWSLYVPNGREIDHPHYAYKLRWLDALAENAAEWLRRDPDASIALMGDWNIAPLDSDVWDPAFFEGKTHVTPAERAAFSRFDEAGYADVVRARVPVGYTYWDYQQLRFPRNEGMRIDFVLGSPAFAGLVEEAEIVRDERKGEAPSDHVPVVVDLGEASGGPSDRPMVF